jgi:hypothetical protein
MVGRNGREFTVCTQMVLVHYFAFVGTINVSIRSSHTCGLGRDVNCESTGIRKWSKVLEME